MVNERLTDHDAVDATDIEVRVENAEVTLSGVVASRREKRIAEDVAAGRLRPDRIDERTFARYLYVPELADADLVWRTSGEQRLSNFMLWQAAYSEFVFSDVLWPDVDRRHLWAAVEQYARRDRRYGGAVPNTVH